MDGVHVVAAWLVRSVSELLLQGAAMGLRAACLSCLPAVNAAAALLACLGRRGGGASAADVVKCVQT